MQPQRALTEYPPDMPWAIVQLRSQCFAVPTHDLQEMVQVPEISALPNSPGYLRGVFNLRGRVLPVVDLRKRIGILSASEETDSFCKLMAQRENDHRNWVAELEASVREGRPFKLARDPHQCAFGKWFDTYRAENVWIAALLKKFDLPHQKIHGIAAEVEKLAAGGDYDGAARLIDRTRAKELSVMIGLFTQLQNLLRELQRETALVLVRSGSSFAVCVDAAVSVEKLMPGSIEVLPPGTFPDQSGVVQRVGKRAKHNEPVLLIETDRILGHRIGIGAAPF